MGTLGKCLEPRRKFWMYDGILLVKISASIHCIECQYEKSSESDELYGKGKSVVHDLS